MKITKKSTATTTPQFTQMTADKDALLREALPCVQYSVNKWAERACAIAQKSFRFPSGAVPTKQQVDETLDKWKQMERLATRITAALAEKDDGGWMPIETAPKDGTEFIAEWVSRSKGSVPIVIGTEYYVSTRDGDEFWWARLPLPDGFKPKRWCPLPKGDK